MTMARHWKKARRSTITAPMVCRWWWVRRASVARVGLVVAAPADLAVSAAVAVADAVRAAVAVAEAEAAGKANLKAEKSRVQ
jgi:hypothetical protein